MTKMLIFWMEPPLTYPPWSDIRFYQPANARDFEYVIHEIEENPTLYPTVMVSSLKNMYSWWGKDITATLIEKLVDVCSRHNLKLIVAPDLDYAKNYMEKEKMR